MRARFGSWRDGRAGLLTTTDATMTVYGGSPGSVRRWPLADEVVDVLGYATQDGEGRWILGISTDGFGHSVSSVECRDWEGRTAWRFQPGRTTDVPMALLYDERSVCGVALGPGGDDGVVALDTSGAELYSRWDPVVYELRTHPGLPGRLAVCSGEIMILDAAGTPTAASRVAFTQGRQGPYLYAHHVAVFPDERGGPALVATGTGLNSVAAIARFDQDLSLVWRATLPDQVDGLALIERPDGPRLFAAATSSGELYVFDEDGTAFLPVRLVDPPAAGRGSRVDAIDAGPFDDGSWGLAVALRDRTLLFEVE
jgi:hypothetical protein